MKIEIPSLARIEGHARLVVDASNGELKECRLEVFESPRFFEGLLKGRHRSEERRGGKECRSRWSPNY